MDSVLEELALKLEQAFYLKDDPRHAQRLRELLVLNSTPGMITELTGIDDEVLIRTLTGLGIRATVHMALQIMPMVAATLASGSMDDAEYETILDTLANSVFGLSIGRDLIESWLDKGISPDYLDPWEAFMDKLRMRMPPRTFRIYGRILMQPARRVVASSEGILWFSHVSRKEKELIRRLERACE